MWGGGEGGEGKWEEDSKRKVRQVSAEKVCYILMDLDCNLEWHQLE